MSDFAWPWEYHFPPFFTIQPHEETRHQQLNIWTNLFRDYLKQKNKFTLNINESSLPLFYNQELNRRLSPESITIVLRELQKTGHAQPLDKREIEWQVYWYTLEEYANQIFDWVQETGQNNTVCTLYEVSAGDNSEGTAFHGIDEAVLLKVLRLMEERGKCEVISMDDSYGVKFF